MSVTLGASAIRTALSTPLRPTLVQPRTPRSAIAAQTMPETREVPSREIRPKEMKEAAPLRFQEIEPQELHSRDPKLPDPPSPETLSVRTSKTLEPIQSRPREPKDLEPEPFRELELTPLDPRELKPRLRYEEMFFRPRALRDVEPFARADLAPAELKAPREGWARMKEIDTPRVAVSGEPHPRGETVPLLDLPDSETYRHTPRVQEINPRLAQSYKGKYQVVHKYSHEPMSHWHYHYNPVPADDVQPVRNRNVVLPRIGGVLDRTT